jgi:hypothetical protein
MLHILFSRNLFNQSNNQPNLKLYENNATLSEHPAVARDDEPLPYGRRLAGEQHPR